MFTHSARFASVSLSGASPDVKANSINLVDKVVQRSISAQGTLPVLMMADREGKCNQ